VPGTTCEDGACDDPDENQPRGSHQGSCDSDPCDPGRNIPAPGGGPDGVFTVTSVAATTAITTETTIILGTVTIRDSRLVISAISLIRQAKERA